ncbi:hypothetical protein C8Q76DRAFT_596142, partial [Earliella scabrosa]
CKLPLVSRLSFCRPRTETVVHASTLQRADFPRLVKLQETVFDQLMEGSTSGAGLSLNVKHAELAIGDLVAIVRSSNVTVREKLADELAEFATEARIAGRSLQALSSTMQGTVDSIMSFNAYAFGVIDAAANKGSAELEQTVLHTFQSSMHAFASETNRLIAEASTTMSALDRLADQLASIHALCVHEAVLNAIALDDLLWELWTMLGGNQAKLRDLRSRQDVLKEVEHHRAVAVAYVSAATQTLLAVDGELSDLRRRLSSYSADATEIPVHVHISSIQRSLERL